jgi:hypothetical protein
MVVLLDKAHSMDQLKGAFISSLFDWARVWGLTNTTLVTLLLSCCNYSFLIVHSLCT